MGFFSDLKDDLSQAVNELMPEEGENMEAAEETSEEVAETAEVREELQESAEDAAEAEIDMASEDDLAQLDAMLEKVDSIELPEETFATEEEEPEYDLETSIREAFGEKEENKGEEKKMDVQTRTAVDETAIITAGMTITGDIASEGSMEVIGTINGNIDIFGKFIVCPTIYTGCDSSEHKSNHEFAHKIIVFKYL